MVVGIPSTGTWRESIGSGGNFVGEDQHTRASETLVDDALHLIGKL